MTDERERREFNAGLSEEVDAWLRGDTSRREFLTRFMLIGGAAMLPGLGYTASGSKAWAAMADVSKVELADKSTPLGQAQAAAVKASTEGPTDGSAYRAVQAAQQYKDKGVTLNLTYEAGLQALEPKNFSGPLWQALTGINFNVVELPHPDQYSKPIAEHIANSGAYDILDIEPAWIPSLANGGVIVPIDDYVAKYMNKADLDDYHPLYKSIPTYKGKRWGFFDDGDQFALYYRKDVFDDPKLKDGLPGEVRQAARRAEDLGRIFAGGPVHHRSAGAQRLWRGAFPQVRQPWQPVQLPAAVPGQRRQILRRGHEGAARRPAGDQDAQADDRPEQGLDPRQQRARRGGAVGRLAAGQGGDDLLLAADRPDVRQLFAARQGDQLHSRSRRSPARSAMPWCPAGNGEMASGYVKALAAGSNNAEAAYLFMQWVTCAAGVAGAHDAALHAARSLSPVALTSPPQYRALWPAAKEYLVNLMRMRQQRRRRHDHARLAGLRAVDRPDVHGGLGRRRIRRRRLQKAAAEWDAIDPAARRAGAEGGLSGVPQAAGLLRRPHDREARAGGAHNLKAAAEALAARLQIVARPISGRGSYPPIDPCARARVHDETTMGQTATAASLRPPFGVARFGLGDRHFKWLMVAPAVLLILALSIYPLLFSLWVAFVNYDFQIPGHAFVGLQNFQQIVDDPVAWSSLGLTIASVGDRTSPSNSCSASRWRWRW